MPDMELDARLGVGVNADKPQSNQPPPDEVAAELEKRTATLVANCNKWFKERNKITSADMAGRANDFLTQLRDHAKEVKEASKSFTKPLKDRAKEVGQMFEPSIDQLTAAGNLMKRMLEPWLIAEDKRIEREKKEKAEAARKAQDEADQKALEAATTKDDAVGAAVASAKADKAAKAATKEAKAAPDKAQARGDYAPRAASLRKPWTFDIVDEAAIPREWLMPDPAKIGQAVRRKDDPVREIPGIKIYQRSGVS